MALLTCRASAFSLLGPYAGWMQPRFGYRTAADIGGPMDFDEGYRWNVPILTYGFDQTFLDYFGSNGVAAVESAIGTLNDLPGTSDIVLSNYPLGCTWFKEELSGGGQQFFDLKSFTLCFLLEHMGLAPPTPNVFVLWQWDTNFFLSDTSEKSWPPGTIPNMILMRNFDCETLLPTTQVNDVRYTAWILFTGTSAWTVPTPVDPAAWNRVSASEVMYNSSPGLFVTGLSRDDVGGLRYLLSQGTQNFEAVLPDVHGTGVDPAAFVNGAWRPGIEKVTFVRHPSGTNAGGFRPYVYQFTDTYITNGVLRRQHLERTVSRPDLLFCAADLGVEGFYTPLFQRTGTESWSNNAALNWDDPTKLGPGVIQPPVAITFHKLGSFAFTSDEESGSSTLLVPRGWASFDGSTNAPVVYPTGPASASNKLLLRLRLFSPPPSSPSSDPGLLRSYTWQLAVPVGGRAALQSSTNLTDWVSHLQVTNTGSVVEWEYRRKDSSQRFFRVLPP